MHCQTLLLGVINVQVVGLSRFVFANVNAFLVRVKSSPGYAVRRRKLQGYSLLPNKIVKKSNTEILFEFQISKSN